jgi:hypothetical protein
VVRELNGIPFEYLSTSPTRDTALESYLSAQVPNPFQGMLPGTGMNGATIQRGQLLRLYPQFLGGSNNGTLLNALGNIGVGGTASVATEEYVGSDSYHAGTIRVEKRFRNGNSLLATYTRSRARDEVNYLNPSDPNAQLEDRISPNDRPNRFTAGATFAFPFGRGQKWGSDWSGATNAILGGWRMSASYQYQTGFPLTWNTSLYYDPDRDPKDLKSNIGEKTDRGIAGLDYPAWDTSGFYVPGGTGTSDDLHLLDVGLYKDFLLPREAVLQLRVEAINALNYTVLWNPTLNPRQANFGLVTQDRNNPRDIQLAVRLTF